MPKKKERIHEGPHKYQKMSIGNKGYQVYKCILPGCRHHLPTLNMALNAETLCHVCNTPTFITKEMLVRGHEVTKPVCPHCRAVKQKAREALIAIGQNVREEDESLVEELN